LGCLKRPLSTFGRTWFTFVVKNELLNRKGSQSATQSLTKDQQEKFTFSKIPALTKA